MPVESRSRSAAHRRLAGCAFAVLACLLAGGILRADPPLTTADVARFLKAGIGERTILTELQDRGFAEPLDEAREATLRDAGATETLVVAVRRAAPGATLPSAPVPATAGGGVVARSGGRLPSFGASTRTVRVPVSVLDKKGKPIVGLRSEDFRVMDGGKPQEVTHFSGERRALRIALALDVSGSMKDKIRQVEAALRYFVGLLEPADEILVLTFSDRVHVAQDFTSDRERLIDVLDRLEPEGATALFDAAEEAIRRVAEGPAESKAVVLVTDGVDTESAASFSSLRELARRSEVPVFSIGIEGAAQLGDFGRPQIQFPGRPGGRGGPRIPGWPGGGGGRGGWPGGGGGPGRGTPGTWPGGRGGGGGGMKPADFDARPLLDLAEETGGRAEIVKTLGHYKPGSDGTVGNELKAAVESIALTLRHRYVIGYEPPGGKPGWRAIKVTVERPSSDARTRKGYYAG